MKNNLHNRLYFGFIVAVLLVMLVGFISFQTFKKQNLQNEAVKHTYQVIGQLQRANAEMVNMETAQRGFRNTNNPVFLEPYYAGLQYIDPLLQTLLHLVQNNIPQYERGKQLQISINELLNWWKNSGNDTMVGKRTTAEYKSLGEKQKMDAVRAGFSEMINGENKLLKQQQDTHSQLVRRAGVELIAGIALILTIVIALIRQVLKELTSRKSAEEELKRNYNNLSEINTENAERNWMLSCFASVNNMLQNQSDTAHLTAGVLNSIIECTGMKAGAFYLYDEDRSTLILNAGFALPATAKKEYSLGETYVGQAAANGELLVVNDIPSGFATIHTGTVAVEMLHAVYMPLLYKNNLKGLIELLSFSPLVEKHLKVLNLLSNNISVALHSQQARIKVMQLLEQVQEQKNTLEHQQEELRQTNEELTVQAEVLQSSEEELRVQEEELKQINEEMKQKNDAVEAAGEALALKAQELEESSRYKSEFLANMSHELRTPLNSVLILAKLMADNKDHNLTEKQITHAQIIHKSGSDLLQLINDILDLSKIEAGKIDIYIEDVPVKTLSADMEQLFAAIAEEKEINFSVNIADGAPHSVNTDKQKLEQVLKNLLSNAFKFTDPKGKIEVNFNTVIEEDTAFLSITVYDNGIGIPADKQKIIFEAFQQADGATNRQYGGTGLGLSITKELVRVLQGKMLLQSKPGVGSEFTVLMPLVRANPKNVRMSAIDTASSIERSCIKEQARVSDDRRLVTKEDKVMLIIDDDEDFSLLMRDFARSHGYKTVIALSGDEGLYCAKKYKPTAIILDMGLPVYNGETLLKIFKNSPDLKHIPVHIISGAEEQKDMTNGALAFLRKPVKRDELEKAFTLISEYLHSSVKRVMVLSENNVEDTDFRKMVSEKNYDVVFDVAENVQQALLKVETTNYDCLIADIGADIQQGIAQLTILSNTLKLHAIPTIIYLDNDITTENELALRKLSDVVVRKSAVSSSRLLDELELFLYKVQENNAHPQLKLNSSISSDDALQNRNVLVVDDDMRNIFALSAALEQEHMNVLMANDGKEALEVLKKNKNVDIVLMDIMMPGIDGYEAIRYIRNEMKMQTLPVIALTAKAMAGDREKCIAAGASDYISKPVDIQKLVSLMRVWLS